MNPLTARVLLLWVAIVVGIPYKACRQAGVITEEHEAGTASELRFVVTGTLFGEKEILGIRADGLGKLKYYWSDRYDQTTLEIGNT